MSRRTRRRRAEASYGPEVGTTYLLHFIDPATGEPTRYKHAGHYIGNPESSGLLNVFGRLYSREFAELGRWRPETDSRDVCPVLSGRRRLGGSPCRCADPQPVAVRVTKFDLAPIGWLVFGPAELGHDGIDITHYQV